MNKITSDQVAQIVKSQQEAKRKAAIARLVAAMNEKKESK